MPNTNINTVFILGLIITANFIYSVNGQTLCPASDCPDSTFCLDKSAGNYENPDGYPQTCFISCSAGKILYCMDCPGDLVYDPASDACDYPSTTTNEEPQGFMRRLLNGEDGSNCPDKSFCAGKSDGNYQNPVGYPQTYFISCDMAENLYCRACPANLIYDPTSDKCDYPSPANIVNEPGSLIMAEQAKTQAGEEANAELGLPSIPSIPSKPKDCPNFPFCNLRRLVGSINGNDGVELDQHHAPSTANEAASITISEQPETTQGVEQPNDVNSMGCFPFCFPQAVMNGNDGVESDAITEGQQPESQARRGEEFPMIPEEVDVLNDNDGAAITMSEQPETGDVAEPDEKGCWCCKWGCGP